MPTPTAPPMLPANKLAIAVDALNCVLLLFSAPPRIRIADVRQGLRMEFGRSTVSYRIFVDNGLNFLKLL